MAQQVRALAALAEDPDLAPSTHMEAHNHLIPAPGDPAPSSGLCEHLHIAGHTNSCRHTHTHNF